VTDVTDGAVDLEACPTSGIWRRGRGGREVRVPCPCGVCAVCGFARHMGIHGPCAGQPPGSKPWGHPFVGQVEVG
jgi:hypothetical protein